MPLSLLGCTYYEWKIDRIIWGRFSVKTEMENIFIMALNEIENQLSITFNLFLFLINFLVNIFWLILISLPCKTSKILGKIWLRAWFLGLDHLGSNSNSTYDLIPCVILGKLLSLCPCPCFFSKL